MPDENRRPEIDFDHHSNDFAQRSIEIFSDLRAHCPVAHTKHHGGYWVATRYEDVATVARDDETFSSEKRELPDGSVAGGITIPSAVGNPIPIETDPPEFFSFRKLLNPYFSPAAVERLRPRIQQLTDECIDSCIESGEIDLVLDLANPVPTIITVEILGLPRELWQRVADAAHAAIYTPPHSPDRERVVQENLWMRQSIRETIEARRREPADDLISQLLAAEMDGRRLTDDEIYGIASLTIDGGVDTTTALTGNALRYLALHPEARRRLIDDPELLPLACEEFLRVYTPVQALARTATRDAEVGGQPVGAGERVLLCWASANRDSAVFEQPDDVLLERFPNRHTAFGLGLHRCLGSNLARAQFCTMVGSVLRRLPDYRLIEDQAVRYESIGIVNGWVKLPATFTPGPRVPG